LSGGTPDQSLWERIAKILEETDLRRRTPPSSEYVLNWSPTHSYSLANVQAIRQLQVGSSVYEVWQLEGAVRTAVYIGEATVLADRLADHAGTSEANPHFKSADFSQLLFSYATVEGEISRQAVERALWKLYSYKWNDPAGPHGGRVTGPINLTEHFPEYYTINFNGTRRPMLGVVSPVILP
jgi:hypothetical protein